MQKKTPFVLLENVDRLLKSPSTQRGRDFGVILACLNELNYSVEWRVVNAAEYGGQQRRRRVYIFAYRNNTKYAKRQMNTKGEKIIQLDGFFAKTFPIEQIGTVLEQKLQFNDIADVSESFKFRFENCGYMSHGRIYTTKVFPVFEKSIPLKNLLEKNVDKQYYVPKDKLEKWKILKGAKTIVRTARTGYTYTFREGAIAYPDKTDLPARTMLTSEATLNRSSHIIRDLETKRLRILTPVEAERIQGFDDNWTNTGMPQRFRYFCMGNALVVQMITRMGNTLSNIIDNE